MLAMRSSRWPSFTRRPGNAIPPKKYIPLWLQSRPQDLGQQLILADFYSAAEQPAKAIQVLAKLVADNPKYVLAKRRLADLYLQQKDYDKATETADQMLKETPADVDAPLIKGRILRERTKVSEAIAQLQKVVKVRPLPAVGHFFLGVAYIQAQALPHADAEFTTAVQNDSTYIRAYLPLAELKLKSGDAETAIRLARQVLALDANLDAAHLLLSRAYAAEGNYQSAANEVNGVLAKRPGSAIAVYHQGLLNLAQGNLAQAEAQLDAAFKSGPDNADGLAALVTLYIRQNQPDKAMQRITQAIANSPTNAGYYRVLAEYYLSQRNNPKAEEAFEKVVSLDPADMSQRLGLADLYVTTGNSDKAIAALQEVLRQDAANSPARARLAEIYLKNKDYTHTLQTAEEMLKANPNGSDALVIKGRALLAESKVPEGMKELQQAVRNDPGSAAAHYYLGLAQYQANDRTKAEAEWVDGTKNAGSFLPLYLSLGELKLQSGVGEAAVSNTRARP